jgi:probable HAF family extracellular repeat protein
MPTGSNPALKTAEFRYIQTGRAIRTILVHIVHCPLPRERRSGRGVGPRDFGAAAERTGLTMQGNHSLGSVGRFALIVGLASGALASSTSFYYRPLQSFAASTTLAKVVLNDGVIVGESGASATRQAFTSDASGLLTAIGMAGQFDTCQVAVANQAGQIAGRGSRKLPNSQYYENTIFRYTPGAGIQELGKFAGYNGTVTAINAGGDVAGAWSVGGSGELGHAFVYTDAQGLVDLGTLGGPEAAARAMNDARQIVGWSSVTADVRHAFFWQNGVMTDLGTLGGVTSTAAAINSAGTVIGTSQYLAGLYTPYRAFVWTAQTGMQAIPLPPGGDFSTAGALGEDGRVYGTWGKQFQYTRVYMWSAATGTVDLGGVPGAIDGHVLGVNALGHFIGTAHDQDYVSVAYLWTPEDGFVNLNAILAPTITWWGTQPVAINDYDEIVVTGTDQSTNTTRSAILVPIIKGDLNNDKVVDFDDINPFVLALTDAPGFQAAFPASFREAADVNADGAVDFGDINPFVALLTGAQ